MSAAIIQDILSKGKAINDNLGRKIQSLNNTNSAFNEKLTNKLKVILDLINKFKTTDLNGFTETKKKLEGVTRELDTTKQNLQQTQSELERVKQSLSSIQNELSNVN